MQALEQLLQVERASSESFSQALEGPPPLKREEPGIFQETLDRPLLNELGPPGVSEEALLRSKSGSERSPPSDLEAPKTWSYGSRGSKAGPNRVGMPVTVAAGHRGPLSQETDVRARSGNTATQRRAGERGTRAQRVAELWGA